MNVETSTEIGRRVVVIPTEVSELLAEVREQFAIMNRTWYAFAKSVHLIHTSKIYEQAGYLTFKEYALAEFPTSSYVTVDKFVHIMENWGDALQSRLKRDGAYKIPAYETCYRVIVAERKEEVPKLELSKIKKTVLDGKLSYHALRDLLKEHSDRGLVDSLNFSDGLLTPVEDDNTMEDETIDAEFAEASEPASGADKGLEAAISKGTDYLLTRLPLHCDSLVEVDSGTAALATKLESLMGVIDSYLDRIEAIGKE